MGALLHRPPTGPRGPLLLPGHSPRRRAQGGDGRDQGSSGRGEAWGIPTKRQHSTGTEGTFSSMEESPKEPYHLFDSQDDWDEAVVEAKTSHINRGYDYDISSGLQRRAVEGVDPGTPPQEHGLTGGQGVAGQPAKAFGLKARQALTGLPRFFRDASSQWCSHRGYHCASTAQKAGRKGANSFAACLHTSHR